ncbi:MAG TPA: hypothetical protein VFV75_05315 [Candidatus Polarisedimenticolaceae bacterium]|nr:hypothetical protein [Candidatus Polarisedimenticolaceae bacterium]
MLPPAVFSLLLAAATPGDPCAAGAAAEQLAAEVVAQRPRAKEVTPARETENEWTQGLSLLDDADAALKAGRAYLALDRLAAARMQLGPLRFLAEHAEQPKQAVDALRAELAALSPELSRPSSTVLPLAVRAFRDEARVQAPVYGHTVAAWDRIEDAQGALFYGGQARELARLAAFDAGLRFPLPPPPPRMSVAAVGEAVDAYERTLVAAYRPPVSADKHQQFILASAALKSARELLAAGSAEGAVWNYLKARRFGAAITRAEAPTPARETLRSSPVEPFAGDASLVCRLTEQVAALLEGEAVPEDRLRIADALLHDVLPAYRGLVSGSAPKTPRVKTAPPEVTVTLVRWPYT